MPRCATELGPVTIVVTSAGIEAFDPVLEITSEKWDRLIAVNLTGTFTCLQLAVADMVAAGWGRIVTISSSSAQSGAPNMAHYVASKGGVIGLTKAFARELAGNGITANTIPPTIVDTPMARKGEAARRRPAGRDHGEDGAAGSGRNPRGHRLRLFVPLHRGGRVHHGPDHRRQRRDVHLRTGTYPRSVKGQPPRAVGRRAPVVSAPRRPKRAWRSSTRQSESCSTRAMPP